MKRYYLMAIEKGHSISMYNLGIYYKNKKKLKKAKKYFKYYYDITGDNYNLWQVEQEIMNKFKQLIIYKDILNINYENGECCVCLDNVDNIVSISCNHKVCSKCITKIENNNCPYCRCDMNLKI
jgi:hypothetical protein